ncbi:hypothetical protein GHT06_015112 [Daphnia sinensis]|uniref:Uncharacterized protein n=1 Tax=Daphnia sinensis TaxID=1820382 RepID=A0AAD5PVU5_9CRUS|nr:hypothetical protein GHT06_015112 [Daphnia sinensis]
MAFSFFPNLVPRNASPSWFQADKPIDEENELTQLEQEHQMWLNSVATKNSDILPIGKTSSEPVEEDEDEEDEEEHEDDDSESREAEDSDIDSFTANGPNFNRDLGEGPPRLANLTMDLSE